MAKTKAKADPAQEVLFKPTDVVVTITLTVRNVFVTALPLSEAVPKEYLYALEGALGAQMKRVWSDSMAAAGVKLKFRKDKSGIIKDHEKTDGSPSEVDKQ